MKEAELSKIIKSWNLPGIADRRDAFELSQKLLRSLSAEESEEKIRRILESELCVTYGLFKTDFNAAQLASEIMSWWNE